MGALALGDQRSVGQSKDSLGNDVELHLSATACDGPRFAKKPRPCVVESIIVEYITLPSNSR